MPRQKDDKKRQAIRNAVVDDVVEVGLAGTSIPRIARRAGLSQGTIYLYFANKDAMLQDVFMEIKEAAHAHLIGSCRNATTSKERIHNIWNALLDFMVHNPKDFAFRDNVTAAMVLTGEHLRTHQRMERELLAILEDAIEDGTLKPAPVDSIVAVLVSPARHLARRANALGFELSAETRNATFDLICSGLFRVE